MKLNKLAIFFLLLNISQAGALGESGGDGGCCGVPNLLWDDAEYFREQIGELEHIALTTQRDIEQLCKSYICGRLSETMAKRLVNNHIFREAERDRVATEQSERNWNFKLAIAGAVAGLINALAAIGLLWHSLSNRQRVIAVENRESKLEEKLRSMTNGEKQ